MNKNISVISALLLASSMQAKDIKLDVISVTATKVEKGTKDVSQSISVVSKEEIESKDIINIKDALDNVPGVLAVSNDGGYSVKLVIRGAGVKAPYGVREIMVIRDGVPMTDPDSFTRFDFIDMQDMDRVEVTKGPGSILATNAVGGVVQLISKSVFDDSDNRIKLGIGNYDSRNYHFRYGGAIDENNYVSITASHRETSSDWRDWNEFESSQASLKYGHIFSDDSTFETELSYSEADIQLATSMTEDEFNIFRNTGEQHNTSNQWQNSGRYSKILFFNAKYEKDFSHTTFKPRIYMNQWEHFHPVTGMINDSDDNMVMGTDLEFNSKHKLFDNDAMLVYGATIRNDKTDDAKKYQYRDYSTVVVNGFRGPTTQFAQTLSDVRGDYASSKNSDTLLYGLYMQESFQASENWNINIGARVDKIKFDIDGNEIKKYDFGAKNYAAGDGLYTIKEDYSLLSSTIGATYTLTPSSNLFFHIARGQQAPTDNEIQTNDDNDGGTIDTATSTNYEIGLKHRSEGFMFDISTYYNTVDDEIILVTKDISSRVYQNAGRTDKIGLEVSGVYQVNKALGIGGNYSYSNYKFDEFKEIVGFGSRAIEVSRADNYLPFIPKHAYTLFTQYERGAFSSRLQGRTWGSYYLDNANTQKYKGFNFVTDLTLGYEYKEHLIQLNVQNLFDKYYASSVKKGTTGGASYEAAAPRTAMLTYRYSF